MGPPKHRTFDQGWILRRPLQIERLRHDLPNSEENEKLLCKLQHYRENLDAVIYALSSHQLAPDRRQHLLAILRRHQQALDECLIELGVEGHSQQHPPLWHFHQLDPIARAHLSSILGVPETPEFFEILNIKAEEYLAQQQAFEALTERYGFRQQDRLARNTKRAALVLTLSGSLIQLSEPIISHGARRYSYQNIYGNAHPPEGILVLDREIEVGHRLRSVELTTSPIRLLRVMRRRISWKTQSHTFERIFRTLTSLVSRSNSRLAARGWDASKQTGRLSQANPDAAERVWKQEYGEATALFTKLRQQFTDERGEEAQARRVEAELLTLCHYLQTGARELGFDAHPLEKIFEFSTDGDHLYQVSAQHPASITLLPLGEGPEVLFLDITVGRQLVTCNAPLALIDQGGEVVEVTPPVTNIKRR